MSLTIVLPPRVAERVRREAERLGVTVEEVVLEALGANLDPEEAARDYIDASMQLLEEARRELERGDVRQAVEKLWGAAALAVKAHALWESGKRLRSHGELWEHSRVLIDELGEWVGDAWAHANAMHICFYEGWCTRRHVEEALKRVEKLVKAVKSRISA